jgi:long-chain acyl-CoA synthetase
MDAPVGFWQWATHAPDRIAIIDPDGTRHTFGEVDAEVNRISNGLRALGLSTGDTLVVLMRNSARMYQLYLAAMQSGLYFSPVNYHSTPDEVAYILTDAEAGALVASPATADVAGAALERAGMAAHRGFVADEHADSGLRAFAELTADASPERPSDRVAGQLLQYTSGTTGRPKGVRRPISGVSPDEASTTLKWFLTTFGMDSGEGGVWLVQAPLYHTANIAMSASAIHGGMTLALLDGWSPELCLEAIDRYQVTATAMVPTHFYRLLQLPEEKKAQADLSSLRYVLHGAAPCPVDVKRRMLDWWGPVIYEYYASTEVGATLATPEQWLERPGTVGRPLSITTLKILDDKGDELPSGEVGKVYMQQADERFEYHNDPEKTRQGRHGDLMTVGDLGYVDEDGFLFLCGRASELIITGGANVYPAEVEGAVLSHPWVRDAGVLGAPDDEYGEVVVAAVELTDDADLDRIDDELDRHCRNQLSSTKCPARYVVFEQLPRDPNGKLYKRRLTEEVAVA